MHQCCPIGIISVHFPWRYKNHLEMKQQKFVLEVCAHGHALHTLYMIRDWKYAFILKLGSRIVYQAVRISVPSTLCHHMTFPGGVWLPGLCLEPRTLEQSCLAWSKKTPGVGGIYCSIYYAALKFFVFNIHDYIYLYIIIMSIHRC